MCINLKRVLCIHVLIYYLQKKKKKKERFDKYIHLSKSIHSIPSIHLLCFESKGYKRMLITAISKCSVPFLYSDQVKEEDTCMLILAFCVDAPHKFSWALSFGFEHLFPPSRHSSKTGHYFCGPVISTAHNCIRSTFCMYFYMKKKIAGQC